MKLSSPSGVIVSYSWFQSFSGAAFDGRRIWFAPRAHPAVVSFVVQLYTFTNYTDWPVGFDTTIPDKFSGALFDATSGLIYLIPRWQMRTVRIQIYATGEDLQTPTQKPTITHSISKPMVPWRPGKWVSDGLHSPTLRMCRRRQGPKRCLALCMITQHRPFGSSLHL